MRLHRLEVTAFGPFAGSERIDFDELNAAGLFLLTGPTGAGKTSVLDAICFALFGTVPGARGTRMLRSQHAEPQARPEVCLEFTVRERRLLVRRTPAWVRPKLRGSGLTQEQAAVTLSEVVDGSETFRSSRAQEVGHLLGDLLGMTATQFVQVALLPQGEFAAFLRATSEQRHDVLQHLFRTDRFTRIETWVGEHGKQLRRRSEDDARAVQRMLDSMADRSGVALPDELAGDDLASVSEDGTLLGWARSTTADAERRLHAARCDHESTRTRVDTLEAAHAQAQRRQDQVRERRAAEAELARLESEAATVGEAREALGRDEHAARCGHLLAGLDEARGVEQRAWDERARCQDGLAAVLAAQSHDDGDAGDGHAGAGETVAGARVPSTETLADRARRARSRLDQLDALLPRESARREALERLAEDEQRIVGLRERVARARERQLLLPEERERLQTRLRGSRAAAGDARQLDHELSSARARSVAAGQVPERERSLQLARDRLREATDAAQAARDTMQAVVAQRLTQMAAELAGGLRRAEPCPVCGSAVHPRPAQATADAVTEQDQQDATTRDERAGRARDEAARSVVDAEHALHEVRKAAADLGEPEAAAQEAALARRADSAREQADEAEHLEQRITEVETELANVAEERTADETTLASLGQACDAARDVVHSVTSQIESVVPDAEAQDTVTVLRERQSALLADLESAARVYRAADAATAAAEDQAARARAAAADEGFGSLEEVRRGTLSPQRRAALRDHVATNELRRTRAEAALERLPADPSEPVADLATVAAVRDAARSAHATATRTLHEYESAVDSLRTNLSRLESAVAAWRPVREQFLRADAMAQLVRGTGGDNHRQMRLSAYVLATRLDQVVEAANERLAQMRDQRYLLERSGRTARKGTPAGLGLDVVDEWTGDVRDPATLSGGETFVVSLALALGLADVVTQEAGGTEIETLFVDEGFGALDADTLDDVMDRLDGLREGGRTVGLVSHVAEMRNRIPTQVHIDKRRTGSSVSVRTMVA